MTHGLRNQDDSKAIAHILAQHASSFLGLVAGPNCTVKGACKDIVGATTLRKRDSQDGISMGSADMADIHDCEVANDP